MEREIEVGGETDKVQAARVNDFQKRGRGAYCPHPRPEAYGLRGLPNPVVLIQLGSRLLRGFAH